MPNPVVPRHKKNEKRAPERKRNPPSTANTMRRRTRDQRAQSAEQQAEDLHRQSKR